MDTEEAYKSNIITVKEIILDEEKLVSYVTISRDLCVHVNIAKQLLCSVIKTIREEQPDVRLSICYIVSGLSADNCITTTICTENELSSIKKSLKSIFFHHVYCVCKGSQGLDNVTLLLLNKYEDYSLCPGVIRSKECIKRTSDEIGNLKTNSQEAIVLENKPPLIKNKLKQEHKPVVETPSKGQVEDNTKSDKQIEVKSETKIKVEVTSPKKDSNNKISHKTNGTKAQKGIASFFNKSTGIQNSKVTNGLQTTKLSNGVQNTNASKAPSVDKGLKDLEENMDIDNENSDRDINIEIEVNASVKNKSKKKEENKVAKKNPVSEEKTKVLNKIKKSSKVEKKRKRVINVSDSEDENDPFVDNQEPEIEQNFSDDEIPPTPSTNSIKITSGIVNPKKRRKVVDKTYTDEEGYILTRKEEIYESCSDNEEETKIETSEAVKKVKEVKKEETVTSPPVSRKNSPKKSKKKISPPQKGKQPTLNSFFTKK